MENLSECCKAEIEIAGTGQHGWCPVCVSIIILPQDKDEDEEVYKYEFINEAQTNLFDFL